MIDLLDTATRLLELGYTPIFSVDKRCAYWGWNTVQPTVEWLSRAHRAQQFIVQENGPHRRLNKRLGAYECGWKARPQALALRLDNGLAVIDLDIDHQIVETVARRVLNAVRALYDAPVRTGAGVKEAWLCRAAAGADFFRLPNRLWSPPGSAPQAEAAETHQVEIFGGGGEAARRPGGFRKPKKYFGCFGAHTVDLSAGEVRRAYSWIEDYSPANVPLDRLPVLSMEDFRMVLDTAEATLAEHGWQAIPRSGGGGSLSGRMTPIYDLTEGMNIDGHKLSDLYRMAESAAIGRGIRTQISPVPWLRKSSKSGASCCLTVTASGAPCIVDWQENTMHLPAALATVDAATVVAKRPDIKPRRPWRWRTSLEILEHEMRRRPAKVA